MRAPRVGSLLFCYGQHSGPCVGSLCLLLSALSQLEDRCLFVATLYAARTGAGAPLAHVVDERAAARYGVAAEALEREWLGGQAERHTSDAALTAFLYADARWAALGLG